MAGKGITALLVMDYQVGVGDQHYAQSAVKQVAAALASARRSDLMVAFTKIDFAAGYADVAPSNKVFAEIKTKNLIPPGSSKIVPALEPAQGEIILNKDRYSAFAGNALHQLLRSNSIDHLVLAGMDTSGVVLSTFIEAVDLDYRITILSDACADSNTSLQDALMKLLFPRSAEVVSASTWIGSL